MQTATLNEDRVQRTTPRASNAKIEGITRRRVEAYAEMGPEYIDRRLQRLDREWDVERMLELNAALAFATGIALGATVDKRWFALPIAVAVFLGQHALQGWCPPLVLFRKLGYRTRGEIDREKYALMAVRGDFVGTTGRPRKSLDAVG
ncbi:MAG TPA: hypothetical protein VEY71_07670 [Chitinophagales bacterium]|nr:hypothetical protein [Chitinophagales bacterium]